MATALDGYDAAVFGDNHKGFLRGSLLNCGGFIRRKRDEVNYKPRVGLLYSDGSIKEEFLDTSEDSFVAEAQEREEVAVNMSEFIQDLEELGEQGLNFRGAVEARLKMDDIKPRTREIILQAIES